MSDANASASNPVLPPIHWVDTNQVPRDPVPYETLLGWIDSGHLPADTPAWWEGLDGWTTAIELRQVIAAAPTSTPLGGDTQAEPDGYAQPTAEDTHEVEPDGYAQPTAEDSEQEEPDGYAQPTAGGPQPLLETTQPGEPATADFTAPTVDDPAEARSADADPMSTASLTEQFADDDLDDTFIELVERSSNLYEESERAATIDQVFLGGVIAAFGDSGFVLIDAHTGGTRRGTASSGSAAQPVLPVNRHELRFEDPVSGARVAVLVDHLTPEAGSVDEPGQLARIELGYGQRVPDSGQVARALHQEMASTFVVSPEPGRLTFDADTSSGFVYCQVDLLWELDRYVDDSINVDADLLRKHLAATVHTLRKFLQLRFGS